MNVDLQVTEEPFPFQGRYGPEFQPMKARWRFRHVASGDIIEVDALVVRTEDWQDRPEAANPAWRPVDFGSLLIALHAVC
jgi:hypothetical protein